MTRLFVAVWPDTATIERLRSLPRSDTADVRWVPEANWHVTLRFIGDADVDRTVELLRGLDVRPSRALLGPTVERLDGRQIVVPVAGVDQIAAAVDAATAPVGETTGRPFRGHLTIARSKRSTAASVIGTAIHVALDVREIALVASDLLPSGAVYTTVATFPLTDRARRRD